MDFEIKGIVAPVFTPIDENGHINFPVVPKYMQYLHQNQVRCILVGGTTGEAMCLSVTERKDILKAWIAVAKPLGVKVIFQVGGVPLPDVIDLTKHATEVQADAIMTLPELYYKPKNAQQLVEYLEIISKVAPSLPLIYYHFPMMSGVNVNMTEFFLLVVSKIRTFKGMKCDLEMAVQLHDYISDQIMFIANHHIAPSVLMEQDSSIATVTNLFPILVHDIVDSMKKSNVVQARMLQERLNKLVDGITCNGEFLTTMKAAMELITGIKMGPPKQPIRQLDKNEWKRIEENLISLNIEIKK